MLKTDAIRLLGGTPAKTAAAIGITPSAVSQWPETLPATIADRVVAALARRQLKPEQIGEAPAKPAKASA